MLALLIKASLVSIVLLAFYKIFLEKESFFTVNRFYLLISLGLAFTLPFLCLPQLVKNQGFVSSFLEKSSIEEISTRPDEVFFPKEKTSSTNENFKNEVAKKENSHLNNPVANSISKNKTGKNEEVKTKTPAVFSNHPISENTSKGFGYWLLMIYFFGVVVLSLNLVAQVISTLLKVVKSNDKVVDDEGTIINMTSKMEPCSFFKYIFINPADYDYETYEQILAHEKIHVQKWHTLDLLFSELAVIGLWFNPFIWKFRKEVEKNIEYQTDDLLVKGEAEEKEVYQMNLLKIATYTQPLSITTNYNQSLIKNRIIKMNSKKSNPHSFWKYAFIAPTIFGLLLILNKPITLQAMNDQIVENILDEKFTIDESSELLVSKENEPTKQPSTKDDQTPVATISDESSIPQSKIEKNPDNNAIVKFNNIADCDELEKAAKAKDLEKVKKLLMEYPDHCLEIQTQDQKDNMALIKSMVNRNAKIYIEDESGNITIKGNTTRIWSDNRHKAYKRAHNSENIFNPIDHKELDEAINSSNELAARNILKNLDPKYLINQDERFLKHLNYMKYILNNGGKLTIDYSIVYIKHDDEEFHSSSGHKYIDESKYQGNAGECKSLINAVRNNNISKIKELLKTVDPNCIDQYPEYEITHEDGNTWQRHQAKTPLIAAGRKGYFEIGKLLIDAGADVNFNGNNGETALIAASAFGHTEFVKYLVTRGANINKLSDGFGSALNAAAREGHTEIVKYLITQGANINDETNGQGSPLVAAAGNGELDVVKFLLEKNAKINSATNGQGSALTRAAGNGELEVVKYLLSKGANINGSTNGQGSALVRAAGNGEMKIVKYLISQGANINDATNGQGSVLTTAAGNGEMEMVKYLLSQGADINGATNGQGSALTRAAGNGEKEMVKYLLQKGAKINAATNGQGSALMRAVQNQKIEMVKFLLENGANPSLSLPGQNSALEKARKNNDRKMYDLLKKYDNKW